MFRPAITGSCTNVDERSVSIYLRKSLILQIDDTRRRAVFAVYTANRAFVLKVVSTNSTN